MCMEEHNFERQKKQIKKVLKKAQNAAYYDKVFRENNICVDKINTYQEFCQLPILNKDIFRDVQIDLIANDAMKFQAKDYECLSDSLAKKRNFLESYDIYMKVTSGSTGVPLEIFKSKSDLYREYRGLNLYRRKVLGKLPEGKYVWIWPANQRIRKYFYSEYESKIYQDSKYGYKFMMPEYDEDKFEKLARFMLEEKISWITAPPYMLYLFASFLEQRKIELKLSYIECHSEKLYDWESDKIQYILGARPISVYSSNEIEFMGMTCQNGNLHLLDTNVFLELLPNKRGGYQVVATSLSAYDIPIVRYTLGDVAHWSVEECSCGLATSIIELTGYRKNDYLTMSDGRKYEAFVVTDAVLLLEQEFLILIQEYVVWQEGYRELSFYLPQNILENEQKNLENYIAFLQQYFYDITKEKFHIRIDKIEVAREKFGASKYKYFYGVK